MSSTFIPLFVTALSIIGAAAVYWYQKSIDRKTTLIELRRAAYRDYLSAFVDMTDSPEQVERITRAFQKTEFDLLIVGTDEVIKAVGTLSDFYIQTNMDRHNRSPETTKKLLAEVCRAMRKDCFEKSNLNIDDVKALVPIASPGKTKV